MLWLIIVVVLLLWMNKTAEVHYPYNDKPVKYNIFQLILLPYGFGPKHFTQRQLESAPYKETFITVRIEMHSNSGLRSWGCYDTIVECLAVGIYLYATFVLTSTLFLNADKAIVFATVMSVSLGGVKILSTLF